MRGNRSKGLVAGGLIALVMALIAACGTTTVPPPRYDINPYEVELSTDPAVIASGQPVNLQVVITGEPPLTKRAEVYFDIKPVGTQDWEEVRPEMKEAGVYSGSYTFKTPGTYSVTIHIITRSVHQIVNRELEVQ